MFPMPFPPGSRPMPVLGKGAYLLQVGASFGRFRPCVGDGVVCEMLRRGKTLKIFDGVIVGVAVAVVNVVVRGNRALIKYPNLSMQSLTPSPTLRAICSIVLAHFAIRNAVKSDFHSENLTGVSVGVKSPSGFFKPLASRTG